MRYVFDSRGRPAIADDMSPAVRALGLLLEHANARAAAGHPLPCLCNECHEHRSALEGVRLIDIPDLSKFKASEMFLHKGGS